MLLTEVGNYQVIIFLIVLLLCVKPLGAYMAAVYENQPCLVDRIAAPLERFFYRICNIQPEAEMDWKKYLTAMLIFNFFGFLFVYLIRPVLKNRVT